MTPNADAPTILVVRRLAARLKSEVGLYLLAADGTETQVALLPNQDANELEPTVQAAFDRDVAHCLVNLENFQWLNSAGLGVLVHALKRCEEAGGKFALVAPNERVTRVLQVAQLIQVFKIFDSEEEAVAYLRS
jgi:anti-sigma B factor antagonist